MANKRSEFDSLHFNRATRDHAQRFGDHAARRALIQANFNRGPLAGRTGNPFKDDPFFNPWAEGGAFNKDPFKPDASRPAYHGNEPQITRSTSAARLSENLPFPSAAVAVARPAVTYAVQPYEIKPINLALMAHMANNRVRAFIDESAKKALSELQRSFNESRRKLGIAPPAPKIVRRQTYIGSLSENGADW